MSFFDFLFGSRLYPADLSNEVQTLLNELVTIGIKEDYLSEFPGNGYNGQCRHVRTRAIGKRLDDIGGNKLMQWAYGRVRKKAGKTAVSHLEYAWTDVGHWQP